MLNPCDIVSTLDKKTMVHWKASAWVTVSEATAFRSTEISPSIPDPSPSKATWPMGWYRHGAGATQDAVFDKNVKLRESTNSTDILATIVDYRSVY